MKIVTVIPLQKNSFKEELTYFSAQNIVLGSIVAISIRNKNTLGLVVSSIDASEAKSQIKEMDFNLKKITETKNISLFKQELIESSMLVSAYFAANKSAVISTLIPNILKENYDRISKIHALNQNKIQIYENTSKNIKTEKLLFQAPFEERMSYYKTLIRTSFANKKSVFLVLPTEHDIANFEETLKKGIENFVVSIHSGLTAKKTLAKIETIIALEHPLLIIGTAPFLSIPRHDLETIILEHENSNAYKTLSRPYLDLRTFVEIFASKIYAKLIFGDTLLRFETIGRRELGGLNELRPLSFRVSFEGDLRLIEKNKKSDAEQTETQKFKVLTDESIEAISKTLSKNRNTFVFSLRKGLATFTVCKSCGNEVSCDTCMAPVVLYVSKDGTKRMFVCNKCKMEKNSDIVCDYCQSWNLVPMGIGTDTVYEDLKTHFPKNKIFKLDKEVATNATEAIKIIKEFENTAGAVLVGTEMALFYLKNKVSLSLIASFDSLWSIPNFKMSEKILQIIFGIMHITEHSFIIETKNIHDEAISAVKSGNLMSYVRGELEDRKSLGYPPYKRFIKVSHLGDKEDTLYTRKALAEVFKDYNPTIFGGFVEKLKGKYTTNLLIKLEPEEWSIGELSIGGTIHKDVRLKIESLPASFSVYIDPEDLL
jgi:primosomal protein N' (replication factor Y)